MERDDLDLRQYLAVIARNKWSILTLSLIITVIAALYVYSLAPVFRATSTILLDPQKQNVVSIEEVYGLPNLYYEYYQTQLEIIRSRELLAKVVNRLNLAPGDLVKGNREPKISFDWRSLIPNFSTGETVEPVAKQTTMTKEEKEDALAGSLSGMVDVNLVNDSHLVNISFDTHNPELAARLANALAEVYIESGLEARLESTRKASEWITEHLKGLKAKVDESSQALQDFLSQQSLVDAQGVDSIAVKKLDEVSTELVDARKDLSEAQELYRQLNSLKGQPPEAFESVPAVLKDPLVHQASAAKSAAEQKVSELSDRYGPKHPKMIAAKAELETARKNLEAHIRNVIDSINKEYRLSRARVEHLTGEMQETKSELSQINRKSNELDILQQELESNRQLYEMFLNRFKETNITDDLKTTNARVVDKAQVPGAPYKPNARRFITISFLTALILSIMLVFLIESLDNTLSSTMDVENKLFLPVLGILPKLNFWSKRDIKAMRYYSDKKHSSFSENIRTIRTSVLLNDIDKEKKIILVTSSVPQEGKSLLAVNLSLSLGQMKKTLLIDADMRKPSIERAFDMKKNEFGLTHFIAGTHPLKECLHYFGEENLHIMPAGQVPSNPLELLSSSRFEKTARGLLQYYDYIVFDSAPAVPVSDPVVLSRIADVTIYVVKADSTPYQTARNGLKKLQSVNANVLGIVLNQVVPAKRPKRYGYGNTDYYSYYGYESKKTA